MTDSPLIEQQTTLRPEPEHHEFTWNSGGLTFCIGVKYTPLRFGVIDHLEVQSLEPAKAALPITVSGYHSHFVAPGLVAEAGGPVEATRQMLEEAAKLPEWQEALRGLRQPSLF